MFGYKACVTSGNIDSGKKKIEQEKKRKEKRKRKNNKLDFENNLFPYEVQALSSFIGILCVNSWLD